MSNPSGRPPKMPRHLTWSEPTLADMAAVADQIAALGPDLEDDWLQARGRAVALLREADEIGCESARQRLENGLGGLQVARALSDLRDGIIHTILDFVLAWAPEPPRSKPLPLCLAPVGGYGRRTLAPGSDIDILFLVGRSGDSWTEQIVQEILYILWDLQLKVGHATRTINECVGLAKADTTIRTNVLEARFLAGNHDFFDKLRTRFWDEVAVNIQDFVTAKLSERDARHNRPGASRYLVEPEIKDGNGGLRDLQTFFWIAKYVYRVDQPSDLVDVGLLTPQEYATFVRCEAFLWTVRCHLHFLTGRSEERLSFELQPDLAERMGYTDSPGIRGVEAFMKNYFLVAKDVGDLTRVITAALEDANYKELSFRGRLGLTPGHRDLKDWPGFAVSGGRITVQSDDIFANDPVNLIRLFRIADKERLGIHPNTLRLVHRSLNLIDDTLRSNETANELFVDILCDSVDPEHTMRRLNEAGILGLFVPDFGIVVAMMQFNMYHHYTVDEHLIRAVGTLSRILNGGLKDDFPFADRVARRIQSKKVLYVAIFLHDIAKGREEDHSIVGERIAFEMGPRFGLSESETELVAWLVRHHLDMSDTAQRRDIFDPMTVRTFAEHVQTQGRLRLLFILTIADIQAVGPQTFNSWKAQLLTNLFQETEASLGGESHTAQRRLRAEETKESVAALLADMTESARQRALHHFSPSYWLSFSAEVLAKNARLLDAAEQQFSGSDGRVLMDTSQDFENGQVFLTVVTPDKPGLFATLVGAVAASGANIIGAKAFTTTDGMALDIFEIQNVADSPFGEPYQIDRLAERVEQCVQGSLNPANLLQSGGRRPGREQAFNVPPAVYFDNDASETFTIVEVERRTQYDLLYRLADALWEFKVSIGSAHSTTFGEKAVDVFYIKDQGGLKIERQDRLTLIRDRLLDVLRSA